MNRATERMEPVKSSVQNYLNTSRNSMGSSIYDDSRSSYCYSLDLNDDDECKQYKRMFHSSSLPSLHSLGGGRIAEDDESFSSSMLNYSPSDSISTTPAGGSMSRSKSMGNFGRIRKSSNRLRSGNNDLSHAQIQRLFSSSESNQYWK